MRLVAEGLGGERGGTELFSSLSFALGAGEGMTVTGPNGAGKSTLLRIIAGLLPPSAGTVRIEGGDRAEAQDALHYLGPLNAMKDQLTASENLIFWQGFLPSHDSAKVMSVAQALDAVRLPHVADIPIGYLSTGQKRRVAIARLLCVRRPVWLTDEPTSGLDKASEQLFASIASEHLTSGGILVAATHLPLGIERLKNLHIDRGSDA
jgi:heme exporter protein A